MPKIIDNPREIILDCAHDIVLEEGYKGLSMREISKKSGIAVGTIYNYFPDKKDITTQLLEDFWLGYLTVLDSIDNEEANIYLKLKKCYEELNSFIKTFKEVWLKNYTEGYTEDTMIRKKNVTEKFNDKLTEMLVKAEENEEINLFMPADKIGRFIIQNLITMCQTNDLDYIDFEQIIKKLLQ